MRARKTAVAADQSSSTASDDEEVKSKDDQSEDYSDQSEDDHSQSCSEAAVGVRRAIVKDMDKKQQNRRTAVTAQNRSRGSRKTAAAADEDRMACPYERRWSGITTVRRHTLESALTRAQPLDGPPPNRH